MDKELQFEGGFRCVRLNGRSGYHSESIHSRIIISRHTINSEQGACTFWVLALEELCCESNQQHIRKHDPMAYSYALLSDAPELRCWDTAAFSLTFSAGWYPQYFVKFGRGKIYPDVFSKNLAYAAAGHFAFPKLKWVQLGVAWDMSRNDCRIFANGIKIGCENKFLHHGIDESAEPKKLLKEPCSDQLYAGNTAFALSEFKFYDRVLNDEAMAQAYADEVVEADEALDAKLSKMYQGKSLPKDDWQPDDDWDLKLAAALNKPADLDLFYVQGNQKSVTMTAEGLEVFTHPDKEFQTPAQHDFQDEVFHQTLSGSDAVTNGPAFREQEPGETNAAADPGWGRRKPGVDGENQMYLWTRQCFEGDLAMEFEFKLKKEFGLGLLCLQATGMQREDFMKDYPLRTSGSMSMVAWENIRNYHWEWFREMGDCYNSVNTHAVCKEPWMKPLAYACHPSRLSKNEWHKLRFVQDGGQLRGIIDGEVLWEAEDIPNENNGPIYTAGHIGLRCMMGTHLIYRNLKVWNRRLPYTVSAMPQKGDLR